jgi:hypothetical protein
MAKVTNAFTTYSATGTGRLSNAIYNIDPFDTPVMSAIRRRNVKNRIFDWQIENLPAAAPAYPTAGYNAQFEGFALVPGLAQPTIRQNNVTQISERDATVSGSQEESDAAGKGSEMAHQMAMMSKVLKSDIETALCSRQQRIDGSDTIARVTEGMSHWIARAPAPRSGAAAGAGGAVAGVVTGLPTIQGSAVGDSTFAAVAGGSQVQVTEACSVRQCRRRTSTALRRRCGLCRREKRTISTFTGRSTARYW